VVEGPPARTILKEAERLEVDLIVLGDKGYNPLSEMLMGSVAQKVSMASNIPVLLVPIHV
jgi:nucleotide-binding universal stress UspA family protein